MNWLWTNIVNFVLCFNYVSSWRVLNEKCDGRGSSNGDNPTTLADDVDRGSGNRRQRRRPKSPIPLILIMLTLSTQKSRTREQRLIVPRKWQQSLKTEPFYMNEWMKEKVSNIGV
jgi:hypothetical protein